LPKLRRRAARPDVHVRPEGQVRMARPITNLCCIH
jgi:hypothetical protein